MNFMTINNCDLVNTLRGIAVSWWVSGCPHRCEGCFNPETWNRDSGKYYGYVDAMKLRELVSKKYVQGFSILGGEPFAPYNIDKVLAEIKSIRALFPEKRIMVWTGYRLQDIIARYDLSDIDYIIDGQFIESLSDKKIKLRGSSNQTVWKNNKEEWTPLTDAEIEEEMK